MSRINQKKFIETHQLIGILDGTRNHHPNFSLFLGAGASSTSGVKTSGELITEWRSKYSNLEGDDDYYIQIIKNRSEEYSYLFDKLYNQPSQRREIIEEVIGDAQPSIGYVYLVNLIKKGVFNAVFTTNFDDLLNEACYLFSTEVRPLVCAHDSSIRNIRITTKRPKIIKLHGDFLYDDIKNTETELESLETNMRDKFKQYAAEYGLIVLGYAGNDRSVMDTIDLLLRDDRNFPHGIYWCVRNPEKISERVQNLTRFPNFYLVRCDGFDEFCAEANDALKLSMQPEMADPYGCVTHRLNTLIERIRVDKRRGNHKIIDRDIAALGETISKMFESPIIDDDAGVLTAPESPAIARSQVPIPYDFLAQISLRNGQITKAYKFIVLELNKQLSQSAFSTAFKIIRAEWRDGSGSDIVGMAVRACSSTPLLLAQPATAFDWVLDLIHAKRFEDARSLLNAVQPSIAENGRINNNAGWLINYAQTYRHEGKDLSDDMKDALVDIMDASTNSIISRWGAAVVLNNWVEAEKLIIDALQEKPWLASEISDWPITHLYMEGCPDSQIAEKIRNSTK